MHAFTVAAAIILSLIGTKKQDLTITLKVKLITETLYRKALFHSLRGS